MIDPTAALTAAYEARRNCLPWWHLLPALCAGQVYLDVIGSAGNDALAGQYTLMTYDAAFDGWMLRKDSDGSLVEVNTTALIPSRGWYCVKDVAWPADMPPMLTRYGTTTPV